MSETGDLSITLGKDDALVLYDLLGRWIEDEEGELIKSQTRDHSDLWVLNGVYCALERVLAEPLEDNYDILVKQARANVRNRCGGDWP